MGEWEGEDIHFGEQGAKLTYGGYLQLPRLLSAQRLESDPPAHDELLFITVHQVYELWFQQLLFEAEAARDAMFGVQVWLSKHLLRRIHAIERVLIEQIAVLETMTPQDFLAFRQHLSPASGFQSVQFRELEFVSGAKDPSFVQRFKGLTEDEAERLARRLEEPTLWDAFLALLAARGLAVGSDEEVSTSLHTAAHDRDRYFDVWELAEALIEHDELAIGWRARHVTMVERVIGTRTGTGGSSGAAYLRSRLPLRYYPALWDLRSQL
ncbi:MAG: tryptophan 2,3-dioxygenase family protein [Actinomycetota bacterium]|nr:tryptophan 2,3-dioxygenase family protein [Actinomycetota bacterium]MDQ3307167.1 tryptophan 2,3-dioxygenase family protein [Actinomycetota bacterium]